jgi:hypothetical protein
VRQSCKQVRPLGADASSFARMPLCYHTAVSEWLRCAPQRE